MASAGVLRRVALVKTDVSEEPSASFIRVTRIGELGTKLAVTSNRRTWPCVTGVPNMHVMHVIPVLSVTASSCDFYIMASPVLMCE
jgi:hypothetical protein